MLKHVVFLALAICQALGGAVELVPEVPVVAPVAAGVVTSRSSQYFAQNHNALAAPLVAPVAPVTPVVEPVAAVAPVAPAARIEAVAPVAPAARIEAVAPVAIPRFAQYIAPSAESFSQVTRYGQYVTPAFGSYIAAPYVASAPFVQAPFLTNVGRLAVAPAAQATPLLSRPVVGPLVARAPVAVAAAQPIAPVQPVQPVEPVAPQQPSANPAFQEPNPDSESVEIESARLRAFPQARKESAQQSAFPEVSSLPSFSNFAQAQQNFVRYQEQIRAQNQRSAAGSMPTNVAETQNQQDQRSYQPQARNMDQQQQRSAAPGLLSSEQYIQEPYRG